VASATVLPAELTTRYESAIVFGRAALVTDPIEKRRALEALAVRFCGELTPEAEKEIAVVGPRTAVLRIRPEHITAKSNRKI
jgi:nitroimidazol reductase NimA-like FMN-containing flavoprotein (pyridoxamine 5'-phosphate oxidase superfamily)